MGAWGTAIFADDTASDVRGEWRDAILAGLTAADATAKLTASFAGALEDDEDGTVFWLALAAAQMETGRLLDEVRDRGLAIIAAGGDVDRWAREDETLGRRRRLVLERLAEKLRGPQPRPKRIHAPRSHAVTFEVGDVVRVRNPQTAAEGLFVVVDQAAGAVRGSTDPVLATLLWAGGAIPPREELQRLPMVMTDQPGGGRPAGTASSACTSERLSSAVSTVRSPATTATARCSAARL